jgi:DNA-binding XRE family transcriptional regulator
VRREYDDCAQAVYSVLHTVLKAEGGLLVQTLEARAKSIDSFGRKAASPSADDPNRPKYPDPLAEITDLAGARIITFLLDTVDQVNEIIEREFIVVEKSIKSGLLEEGEKLGYQSVHFLVKFSDARCALPEYARFENLITEIHVLAVHPTHLIIPELVREITAGAAEFSEGDGMERAVRDLTGLGLLHCPGGTSCRPGRRSASTSFWGAEMASQSCAAYLAANLKHCRAKAGLSQEEVGFRAELHRTEIGLLERGARVPQIHRRQPLRRTRCVASTPACALPWATIRCTWRPSSGIRSRASR